MLLFRSELSDELLIAPEGVRDGITEELNTLGEGPVASLGE